MKHIVDVYVRENKLRQLIDIQTKWFDFLIGETIWGYCFDVRVLWFGIEFYILKGL